MYFAKCQILKIFWSFLYVLSHTPMLCGHWCYGWWSVLVKVVKEVKGYCPVLQQTIAQANIKLYKWYLPGGYNLSAKILIMSKFGGFHSFNNVGRWTTGSLLVAVMTSCCNDLTDVWCQAIINPNQCNAALLWIGALGTFSEIWIRMQKFCPKKMYQFFLVTCGHFVQRQTQSRYLLWKSEDWVKFNDKLN